MSNNGGLNNPKTGTEMSIVPIINSETATALAHGDVVCIDQVALVADAAAIVAGTADTYIGQKVKLAKTATKYWVAGVVWDPNGLGVAAGERGSMMVKGYHPAVKTGGNTVTNGSHFVEAVDTGKCVGIAFSAGFAGNMLGIPLATGGAGDATIPMLVSARNIG